VWERKSGEGKERTDGIRTGSDTEPYLVEGTALGFGDHPASEGTGGRQFTSWMTVTLQSELVEQISIRHCEVPGLSIARAI